jgi:hypothetical protein
MHQVHIIISSLPSFRNGLTDSETDRNGITLRDEKITRELKMVQFGQWVWNDTGNRVWVTAHVSANIQSLTTLRLVVLLYSG